MSASLHFVPLDLRDLSDRAITVCQRLLVGCAVVFGISQPVQAGPALSLDQLIGIGLNENAYVLASRDQVAAARGDATIARAYPNPDIGGQLGRSKERNTLTPISGQVYNITMAQPIEIPMVRSARIDAADEIVKATDANRQSFEDDTVARIKLAYYELLRRMAETAASDEDLALTQQIRDRIALRHQVGESPKFDLIRAETEMLNARKNNDAARLRVEQARANLRLAVGHPLPEGWNVQGNLPTSIKLPPKEALKAELLARNPVLMKTEAEQRAAEHRLSMEKSMRLPKIALIAEREVDPTQQYARGGLVMTIPLWDWRSGQISKAKAELSSSRHQLNAQRLSFSEALEATYQLYQIASNQVRVLETELLSQAAAAQRIAESAYRYGERGILEWLDAQRTYRAARNELIAARFDLATVSVEIDRLRSISHLPPEQSTQSPNKGSNQLPDF
jgi:cobalt-zinc-cadmium efflux system outer membrane protein